MRQRHAFLTHKGCAVYALHFNAYMDLKPFMRQARYAASHCVLLYFMPALCVRPVLDLGTAYRLTTKEKYPLTRCRFAFLT